MMKLLTMSNRKERFVFEIFKAVNAKYMSHLAHIILKSLQWASLINTTTSHFLPSWYFLLMHYYNNILFILSLSLLLSFIIITIIIIT